jgi:hypothetical protein
MNIRLNTLYRNLLVMLAFCPPLIVPSYLYAQAPQTDSVIFFSEAQLDSALNSAVTPQILGRSKENGAYILGMRTKPGDVEIHEQWDDVAIIRSGTGILRTGLKVKGQKESGKEPTREWRGGVIENPKERKLAPGDFIVIPAMLPHQYIPTPGDSLISWTIKVKRPRLSP